MVHAHNISLLFDYTIANCLCGMSLGLKQQLQTDFLVT